MKRGILVATVMMTAAGVASANVFTAAPPVAPPQIQAPQAQAPQPAPPVALARPAEPASKPAPKVLARSEPAPVVEKASVETRQAPVPFQMKPRPAVNLPPVEDKAAKASGKPGDKPGEASATGDAGGESAARAAIEADGYKGVTVLRKGVNGVWHAKALRGKTEVMLTVDATGSVSAN